MNLDSREWLETDGLGGVASGTVGGVRTRRYHGLLVVATTPPTGRMMLVNGFDAWVETPEGRVNLSTQRYLPDVLHRDGFWRLDQFHADPWPTWRWRLTDGADVTQEIFIPRGSPRAIVRWHITGKQTPAKLFVRPLLSGRDYHQLHHENPSFNFNAETSDTGVVTWHPYLGVPGIRSRSNGTYSHDPVWYRSFLYLEERSRGLDDTEDLASPGLFEFDLGAGEAIWIVEASTAPETTETPTELGMRLRHGESERRRAFPSRLHRNADHYVVKRGDGCTIVAGYPWFTDWGRDTFIAMRGLLIGRGKHAIAASILLTWAQFVSEGMLPNRFPDYREEPEYNAVDASLWYVIAVHEYLAAANAEAAVRARLLAAVTQILDGYAAGTRFGIRMDDDGLLACGGPGTQLTWMDVDVRIGEQAVTCRAGKPVEVEALWVNALRCAGGRYAALADRATLAFNTRFWNAQAGCLYDVVDVDHERGRVDASVRPNQVFAVGGLPWRLVTAEHAHAVVATIERELLTPLGLRTLSPRAAGYRRRYEGDRWQRDTAYHQGTAWPWLTGAFVDAWFAVHGDDAAHRAEARERFVAPLCALLAVAGLGHVSEIADGDAPHTPRGCPFQAWSLGELLRMLARTAA